MAVLQLAAEKAGWGRPLPKGHGLGIAFAGGYDAYCAQVIEVKVERRNLRIERIVCAFDCGMIIDPRAVEAQVEGASCSASVPLATAGSASRAAPRASPISTTLR
jgi:isoquinoline 1-oxidoreductase beta subunit